MMKSTSPQSGEGAVIQERGDRGFVHTSFRTSQLMLDRLDVLAGTIQNKQVGKVTRADVIRTILGDGITRLEATLFGKSWSPEGAKKP